MNSVEEIQQTVLADGQIQLGFPSDDEPIDTYITASTTIPIITKNTKIHNPTMSIISHMGIFLLKL